MTGANFPRLARPVRARAVERLAEVTRNEHLRRALWVTTCVSLAFVAIGLASGAVDETYYFIDEGGVTHFSNVPTDSRYKLLLRSTALPRLDAAPNPPAVILFAPPMVDQGTEFTVNILFANFAALEGWLEIGFDPAVLTLVGTNVDQDVRDAGRVRVTVYGGPSSQPSADLQFLASGHTSKPTSIIVTETSLETETGEPVGIPSAAEVAISSFGR